MEEIASTIDKVRVLLSNETPVEEEDLPEASTLPETPDLSNAFDPTSLSVDPPAHLSLVGLTPPGALDIDQAHQDAFHIPELLVPELHGATDAGTVITVGVFNAAFLPVWSTVPFRTPLHKQQEALQDQKETELTPYFSDLGLNKGLVERLAQFAKNQTWVLVWLSGLTKTVSQVLRVLRRENPETPIQYEDEAAQEAQKKRRILKI
jgi:hypothetical protein